MHMQMQQPTKKTQRFGARYSTAAAGAKATVNEGERAVRLRLTPDRAVNIGLTATAALDLLRRQTLRRGGAVYETAGTAR